MEPIDWVPWALCVLSVPQALLLRKKNRTGWVLNCCGALTCAAYNIATQQWGFLPINLWLASMSVANFVKWRRDDRRPVPAQPGPASR